MTLGKFLAWLMFTALVAVAGQFTDRSPPAPASDRLLASSPAPKRSPDATARRHADVTLPLAQARTTHASVTVTP